LTQQTTRSLAIPVPGRHQAVSRGGAPIYRQSIAASNQATGQSAAAQPRAKEAALKAYVINLDRSADRLDHMRAELGRVGVEFERIAAVDGSVLEQRELDAFCRARSAAKPQGWLAGEVGCFLSHFDAWRRIAAAEHAWAAVLEDDLRVSRDLAPLLASTDWIPADADAVRLEANRSMRLSKPRPIAATPGRYVYRAISGTTGAGAYILSRSAAKRLLATPPESHTGVDVFLFKPKMSRIAKELRRYQVVPAVSVQDGLAEGREGPLKSLIRKRNTFGRGYRKQTHPLLRVWPIQRFAVPFRP
jgi:glycosyl transferase family 25